jgi:hypothetical protein
MKSCLLFHGPDAESCALQKASQIGRLLAPPFGKDGLKVEDARQIVSLLNTTPVGDAVGVLVVGPMEMANTKSSDVLLKSLEEFQDQVVQPVLWANDLGGVSNTIRSRCIDVWSPGSKELSEKEIAQGKLIVDSCLDQKYYLLPSLLEKSDLSETQLIEAIVFSLSDKQENESVRLLWEKLRETSQWRNPTKIEILFALLGDA